MTQGAVQGAAKALELEHRHERRVEAFYSNGASQWFEFKRQRGEIPYSTWGLWDDGVATPDAAFGALIEDIVRRGKIGASDRVLDVGCGYGASSVELARRSGCAAVLGIDLTAAFVAHSDTLIEDAGKRDVVSVRRMSATSLELADSSYDVVTAIDCACHFDTRERFLSEAARVLRPGGRLVLLDLLDPGHPGGVLRRLVRRLMMGSWNVPAVNRYGAARLEQLLAGAGFQSVDVEPVTARMLPGSIASQRAPEFRRAYARAFGRISELSWQLMLSFIAKIHTWKLGEFVMVTAVRSDSPPDRALASPAP